MEHKQAWLYSGAYPVTLDNIRRADGSEWALKRGYFLNSAVMMKATTLPPHKGGDFFIVYMTQMIPQLINILSYTIQVKQNFPATQTTSWRSWTRECMRWKSLHMSTTLLHCASINTLTLLFFCLVQQSIKMLDSRLPRTKSHFYSWLVLIATLLQQWLLSRTGKK